MFRGQGFQYSAVRVQSNAKSSKRDAILLRRRKLFPKIYPSLVLAIGVAVAGIAAILLGMLG
jgi:hypothetical protein